MQDQPQRRTNGSIYLRDFFLHILNYDIRSRGWYK